MVKGQKPDIEGILMCILVIHIVIFLGGGRQKCPAATGIHTVAGAEYTRKNDLWILASEVLTSTTRWQCGPSNQGGVRPRGAVMDCRGNGQSYSQSLNEASRWAVWDEQGHATVPSTQVDT